MAGHFLEGDQAIIPAHVKQPDGTSGALEAATRIDQFTLDRHKVIKEVEIGAPQFLLAGFGKIPGAEHSVGSAQQEADGEQERPAIVQKCHQPVNGAAVRE